MDETAEYVARTRLDGAAGAVAAALRVSGHTLRKWIDRGVVPTRKVDGVVGGEREGLRAVVLRVAALRRFHANNPTALQAALAVYAHHS